MSGRLRSDGQRSLWGFTILFDLLHLAVSTCLPPSLDPLSTICIVFAEIGALIAALRVSRTVHSPVRILWFLLGSSIIFHSTAMTLDAVTEATGGSVFNYIPGLSIFFSMLYDVPLLVAVSMQFDSRIAQAARVANALLSLAIGFLLYQQIFSLLTVHGSRNPADAALITWLFDGLDLFLAVTATIRWFGSADAAERSFFRIATIFLWLNTICPAIHNRLLVRHDYVWLDLFISTPYAVLWALIMTRRQETAQASMRVGYLVQSGSAIFLSIALLVMGIITARTHFYLGLGASLLSVMGYGALSTLAQSRSREAEESLLTSKEALEGLVGVDGLTGISNRWSFDQTLQREFASARRAKSPLSLLMIDIDHFKLLNDAKGHQVGDTCLRRIASALHAALPRTSDFVARYGGEEFAALLPATDRAGAEQMAQRICTAITALQLEHPDSPTGVVTISVGVSTYDGSPQYSSVSLVRAADEALYRAKHSGRNRSFSISIDAVEV